MLVQDIPRLCADSNERIAKSPRCLIQIQVGRVDLPTRWARITPDTTLTFPFGVIGCAPSISMHIRTWLPLTHDFTGFYSRTGQMGIIGNERLFSIGCLPLFLSRLLPNSTKDRFLTWFNAKQKTQGNKKIKVKCVESSSFVSLPLPPHFGQSNPLNYHSTTPWGKYSLMSSM